MLLGKRRQVGHIEVCEKRTYFGLEILLSYGVSWRGVWGSPLNTSPVS